MNAPSFWKYLHDRQQPWTSYIIRGNKNVSQADKSSKFSLGLCFVSSLSWVRSRIVSRFSPVFLTSKVRWGRYYSSHRWLARQNQEIFWCQRGSGVSETNKGWSPRCSQVINTHPLFFLWKKLAPYSILSLGAGASRIPQSNRLGFAFGVDMTLQLFKSKTSDSQVSKWTGPERWHRTSW